MGNGLSRGSVVLATYPFTDLSSAKRRPALVVSATGRPGRDCIVAGHPLSASTVYYHSNGGPGLPR